MPGFHPKTLWGVAFLVASVVSLWAEEGVPPRLSAEQERLFAAVSDPYYQNGAQVDVNEDERLTLVAPLQEHVDPRCQRMAQALGDFIQLNRLAEGEPAKRDKMMEEFSEKWNGLIWDTTFEETLERSEAMGLLAQKQAIRERNMEIFGADLRGIIRNTASRIASDGDAGRPKVSGVLGLALKRVDPFVHMQVRNLAPREIHHCVITSRRIQDSEKHDFGKDDEQLASALMALTGFSGNAIETNREQAVLLDAVQHVEHGAFIYVPVLGPGEAVSFIVSPVSHFGFTKAVEASLWCDEGQELNSQVDLPGFFKETYDEQQRLKQRQPAEQAGMPPFISPDSGAGPLGVRPSSSGLNGATGLQGAKGF